MGSKYHLVQAPQSILKDEQAMKAMKDAGCTMRVLTWEEKVKWANAITDIPNERAAEINKAGIARGRGEGLLHEPEGARGQIPAGVV